MSKPIVAIVGRQNVGKSTLLNRVAGKPIAIVADLPGTTRDRIFANVSWQGVEFIIIDTGGLEPKPQTTIDQGVKAQVEAAITEADAIIFFSCFLGNKPHQDATSIQRWNGYKIENSQVCIEQYTPE